MHGVGWKGKGLEAGWTLMSKGLSVCRQSLRGRSGCMGDGLSPLPGLL